MKVAICINMLAPYWKPVFDQLGKIFEVKVFVGTYLEANRQYSTEVIAAQDYHFQLVLSKNILLDLRKLQLKTEFLYLQVGLWKDLTAYKPDVIISNELGVRTAIALLYGKRFNIPVIPWICVSSHTERNISFCRRLWRKFLLTKVHIVFTNLNQATEYLSHEFSLNKEQIFNVPYTLDVDDYNHKVINAKNKSTKKLKDKFNLKGKVFLYIGQMIERKGIYQLKYLFDNLPEDKDSFTLLFVGGILPNSIKKELSELKINFSNIEFVQPNELPIFYALADLFFFPSLEDEWGIVLNEAAAAGLPLLASTYAAAAHDLVIDGVNGFVFDPLAVKDFRKKFSILLQKENSELLEMGKQSKIVAKKYGLNFTVNNFIAGIKKSISKSS